MEYIQSDRIKREKIQSLEIERMVPWVVGDGSFAKLLTRYFPKPSYGATCDIGCGSGATLRAARAHFGRLCGVDLTSYLADDMTPEVEFTTADLNFEALPHTDASIDLVTAFQVIEHLENPFFVMREARRILKPGGFFMFSVPNPYQITFRVKYLFTSNMPPWTVDNNHLLFFTKAVLEKTYLTEFKLVETLYQRGAIPMWGRLRPIFGKRLIKKHAMVLPRSEWFGRRVLYVLSKKRGAVSL